MKADKVKLLLPLINSKMTGTRGEWVLGHCPMAPFKHSSGKDAHPSFGIKSSSAHKSICKCLSCGYGGDLDDLMIDLRVALKKDPGVAERYKMQAAMQLIASELDDLQFDPNIPDFDEAKKLKASHSSGLVYPESWLKSFASWSMFPDAREYLKSRGISPALANHLDIRFDPLQQRVCFPFRNFKKELMGVQGRLISKDPTLLRYFFYDYGGHKNMHVWMGEDRITFDKPLVLVEGPFDLASVYRAYPNVVASFTSGLSVDRVRRIADASEIITFYDYGAGGNAARGRVEEVLKGVPVTHLIPTDSEKDPGAMSYTEIVEALRDHVNLAPFTHK